MASNCDFHMDSDQSESEVGDVGDDAGILYKEDGKALHVRRKKTTKSKNKKIKGKKPVARGSVGEKFEFDVSKRTTKRSDRRQGIYVKLRELNIVTGDHAYVEFFKMENEKGREEEAGEEGCSKVKSVPDVDTKLALATHPSLFKSSNQRKPATEKEIEELDVSTITEEEASSFATPSKMTKNTKRYMKRVIAQTRVDRAKKCQKCGTDDNRSTWLGCDLKDTDDEPLCEYWMHCVCIGFPIQDEGAFKNLPWYCPAHVSDVEVSESSKKKNTSKTSLWKK